MCASLQFRADNETDDRTVRRVAGLPGGSDTLSADTRGFWNGDCELR